MSEKYSSESLQKRGCTKTLRLKFSELENYRDQKLNDTLLSEVIKYLLECGTNYFVESFSKDTLTLIEYLFETYSDDYETRTVIWTKYLDICTKLKYQICKEQKEPEEAFNQFQRDLLATFYKDQDNAAVNWRVIKKVRQFDEYFDFKTLENTDPVLAGFKNQIMKSLEYLVLHSETNYLLEYTKKILIKLLNILESSSKEKIIKDIIHGRFEKNDYFDNTLVMGEDGGLFLLLNTVTDEELEGLKAVVSEDYLKDKVKKLGENKNKISIGKGAFGTVRFAMAVFVTHKAVPGQIACVKKTRSIKFLENESFKEKDSTYTEFALGNVIDTTVGDYFASNNEITSMIYSPVVLDSSMNISSSINELHRKGYLFMEVVPQNTGTNILIKNPAKVQLEWAIDIKPYILQVFNQTYTLLENNIAMTDLKPDNTLYDIDKKRAFIVDLGGSVFIKEGVEKCMVRKHNFQATAAYKAPEFNADAKILNLKIAISFSCGKILEEVIQANPTVEGAEKLLQIAKMMMNEDINTRMTIDAAIKEILPIGNDQIKNSILFERYISKLKSKLQDNRSSISINEDIYEVKQMLINPRVIEADPDIYHFSQTDSLKVKFREFFDDSDAKERLMLILGNAGSGKSIILQLQFIEAIENWDPSKPLPIYFNLSNGTNLAQVIKSLDNQLNTNLYDFLFDKKSEKNLSLFIDSFDEGIYSDDNERESKIQSFRNSLKSEGNDTIRFLVSCRSDYLHKFEKYEDWFKMDQFFKYYIVPLNYQGKPKIKTFQGPTLYLATLFGNLCQTNKALLGSGFDPFLKELEQNRNNELKFTPEVVFTFADYIEFARKNKEILIDGILSKDTGIENMVKYYLTTSNPNTDPQKYINMINEAQMTKNITTGFIFHMLMKTFDFYSNGMSCVVHGKISLYRRYILMWIEKNMNWNFKLSREQRLTVLQQPSDELYGTQLKEVLFGVGIHIASILHVKQEYRLRKDDEIFKILGFEEHPKVDFKHQRIYFILRNLPLKIEIKTENGHQDVAIGFIHDTLKNYYLLEGIMREARNSPEKCSKILGGRNAVENTELMQFLRDALLEDHDIYNLLTKFFLQQIYLTKENKDEEFLNSAANSASILAAAKFSFKGLDFSNAVIRKANLRNANFNEVNLTNADLSYSNLMYIKFINAKLVNTNLKNVTLGISPDLDTHTKQVNKIAFSPDGKYVATGSDDQFFKVWDPLTGKEIISTKDRFFDSNVKNVVFSPNGKLLACGGDHFAEVWDLASKKLLCKLSAYVDKGMAFSPDSNFVAISGYEKLEIFKLPSGDRVQIIKHIACSDNLAYSPDGTKVVTISKRYSWAYVWDPLTGKELFPLRYQAKAILACGFSSDGKYIATCGEDKTAKVYHASDGTIVYNLPHDDEVTDVKFSPNNKFVATCSSDKSAKVWSLENGQLLTTLKRNQSGIGALSYSPDSTQLATCYWDGTASIWDATSGEELRVIKPVSQVVYSPDGKYIMGSYENTVRLWSSANAQQLQKSEGHTSLVSDVKLSFDGKLIATASYDKTAKIWNAQNGQEILTLVGHNNQVSKVAFSPDLKFLATACDDSTVKIWDINTGKEINTLVGHTSSIVNVLYSPDGKTVTTLSWDHTARIWDPYTAKELHNLQGHTTAVTSVCYSSDGKYIATSAGMIDGPITGIDNTAKIWDVASGKIAYDLTNHGNKVNCVCFSPNGKLFASCSVDRTAKIWDLSNGKELATLKGHTADLNMVAFSPDSKTIATVSSDKTAKIWDTSSFKLLHTCEGHTGFIFNLKFSRDGRYIITASYDKMTKVWDLTSGKLMQTITEDIDHTRGIDYSTTSNQFATCAEKVVRIWEPSTSASPSFTTEMGLETPIMADSALFKNCQIDPIVQKLFQQRKAKVENDNSAETKFIESSGQFELKNILSSINSELSKIPVSNTTRDNVLKILFVEGSSVQEKQIESDPSLKCSSASTGFDFIQEQAYLCNSCGFYVCKACTFDCHKGHDLLDIGKSFFICQCMAFYSECNKVSKCTRIWTGKSYVQQIQWTCNTCNFGENTLACSFCIKNCHKDHEVKVRAYGLAFCDCPDAFPNCSGK